MVEYARLFTILPVPHFCSCSSFTSPSSFHSICSAFHHFQSRPYAQSLGVVLSPGRWVTKYYTTLAFPAVLQNIISQDLKQNLIILINMCCSTYQGSLKYKLNIQTLKTTLGYTWHQTDWEEHGTGNTAHLQGTMRHSFSKGGPVEAHSAVQELFSLPLYLPGESSGPRRWDSYWIGHPQEPISPAITPKSCF